MPGIRVDPNTVLGSYEVELDGNGKVTKSNVKTIFDALNYDAPTYAICCDLRADGGFLPVLNDTVPLERANMVRSNARRMNMGPVKKDFSAPIIDSSPYGPPQVPNRPHGEPWTSTGPGGPFSQYPYLPEGPPPAGATSAEENQGPWKSGAASAPAAAYPYLACPPSKSAPPLISRLKTGKGPALFDSNIHSGPTAAPMAPLKREPVVHCGKMRTNTRKPLGGTFGSYPQHMSDPYQDNPLGDGKQNSKLRGFFTCYTVSKPNIPILNVWDAPPLVKTRAGVKRSTLDNRMNMTVTPYDPKVSAIMERANRTA